MTYKEYGKNSMRKWYVRLNLGFLENKKWLEQIEAIQSKIDVLEEYLVKEHINK